MLYVALMKAKPGSAQERTTRRVEWQIPEIGAEFVAEYWLQTPDPAVIAVFKADHISQMWALTAAWDDLFEISIYPAITGQEGIEVLKQMPQP